MSYYLTASFRQSPKYPTLQFFHQLHRIYAANARLLITIITPAAIFSGCAVLLATNRAVALFSQGYGLTAAAVRLGGWTVSFLVNVFAFGAVATAIQRVSAGMQVTAEECYAPVRARAGVIGVLALALFAGTAAVFASVAFIGGIFFFAGKVPRSFLIYAGYLVMLLGWTVVATYSLAVPIAVFEGGGIRAALKRSDFLTGSSFGQIFLLVAEAVATGYVAGVLPYWAATFIAGKIGWAGWANWGLWAATVYGIALADLVLLIGLSVLYLELTKSTQSSAEPGSDRRNLPEEIAGSN